MSKVAIEGNVSGTGTLTIAAPNTNTNRTLTLPDATGTLALTGAASDKIEEGNSKVEVTDAGTGKVEITVDAVEVADFTTGTIVFNETGANQDFRVEGDTNANLLFVDASADTVGIGTNAPTARLTAIGSATLIGATNVCARFSDATNSTLVISHPASNGSTAVIVGNAQLGFATSDGTTTTERARITSAGVLCVGTTAPTDGETRATFLNNASSGEIVIVRNSRNISGDQCFKTFLGSNCNDTSSNQIACGVFAVGNVMFVRGNGNLVNTNNSYGSISDIKIKQDIVDANSQWDDIKNIRVRKFRFKNNPTGPLQIGVVAQELEEISPGLIDESQDYEEVEVPVLDDEGNPVLNEDSTPQVTKERNALGTTTKAVKYSVLYMKAVKALQEAIERIETLEAKVAALENNNA